MWYIKQDRYSNKKNDELDSWTITTNPDYCGWKTEAGFQGYGLPKELAQWICDKLNQCDNPPYIRKKGRWEKHEN